MAYSLPACWGCTITPCLLLVLGAGTAVPIHNDGAVQGLKAAQEAFAAAPLPSSRLISASGADAVPTLGRHHVLRTRLQEVLLRCAIDDAAWPAALHAARGLSATYHLLYPPVSIASTPPPPPPLLSPNLPRAICPSPLKEAQFK